MRVSWTQTTQSSSGGYLITTGDTRPTDFSVGTRAASTASSREVGQVPGTTVSYWLVALYGTPIVVGPVSGMRKCNLLCTVMDSLTVCMCVSVS